MRVVDCVKEWVEIWLRTALRIGRLEGKAILCKVAVAMHAVKKTKASLAEIFQNFQHLLAYSLKITKLCVDYFHKRNFSVWLAEINF